VKTGIRTLADLGDDLVLAPERWLAIDAGRGVPMGDLVVERREKPEPNAVVVDTTHARDGVLDLPSAVRARADAKSAKKRAVAGDLVVSRLRPYLRQIAFVDAKALATVHPRGLAFSTEYYVLAPREGPRVPAGNEASRSIAFLVPFLLGPQVQRQLAAAQEGGHHPRVPRASLLAIRVPEVLVERRAAISRNVIRKLAAFYRASAEWNALLNAACP
jgi:hypothetical protein